MSENTQRNMPNWIRIDGLHLHLNAEAAGRFFGVTPRTLLDWVKHGCPKVTRGWYPIQQMMEWLGRTSRSATEEGESLGTRNLRAETEYREAKARREEMLLQAALGKYLPRDEIEDAWGQRVIEIKAGLLAMARKASSSFPDPDMRRQVEKILYDEVYDLLDQYSRTGQYTPRQRATAKTRRVAARGTRGVETPGEIDGQPVG